MAIFIFIFLTGFSVAAQEGIGGVGLPTQSKPSVSVPTQSSSRPQCDIVELGTTGFGIKKGSSILNGGISRDGAFQKLELYVKNGQCVTDHKRKCFFADTKSGRTIGFQGTDGKRVILGLAFGSAELAIGRISKAKSLGLCDEIVDEGFIK
jgi:hypothetical protein